MCKQMYTHTVSSTDAMCCLCVSETCVYIYIDVYAFNATHIEIYICVHNLYRERERGTIYASRQGLLTLTAPGHLGQAAPGRFYKTPPVPLFGDIGSGYVGVYRGMEEKMETTTQSRVQGLVPFIADSWSLIVGT